VADQAPPFGPIKLVILPRTLAGLGRAGLRRHLSAVHGPMVMSEPAVSGTFRGYVHHYAIDCPVEPVLEDRDAVTVIRFDALADMAASRASAAYRERIGPDEDNFREIEGSVAMFAQEQAIAPGTDDAPRKLFAFRTSGDDDLDVRADRLSAVISLPGVRGVTTNLGRVIEDSFDHRWFDEIGLDPGADVATVARTVATLDAASDVRFLLVDALRFI